MLRPLLAVLFALLAFDSGHAAAQDGRRARGDLAIEARGILRKYCGECHGPNQKVHNELSVLNHRQLVNAPANRPELNFVAKGNDKSSYLLELIECGAMPPGGLPRPTPEEIDKLKAWVNAKAPSYPEAFDDRTTLAVMLEDLDRHAADAEYLRYLSFAHLVEDGKPLPDLRTAEGKLKRALTAAGNLTKPPEPVDDTATLYRLDLRDIGWHQKDLFRLVVDRMPQNGAVPLVPYDLILFEYPHGYTLPPGDLLQPRLAEYLNKAKQARPVAFVRADWLSSALRKSVQDNGKLLEEDLPLAEELKSLYELGQVLPKHQADPKKVKLPSGPRPRPFLGAQPVLMSVHPEKWQPINPFSALYSGDVSPNPPPFKFTAEFITTEKQGINEIEQLKPFQIQLRSDRRVFFVVLRVDQDGEAWVQPVEGGNLVPGDNKPRRLFPGKADPSNGGGFRISSIEGGNSAMEYFIVIASEVDIPTKSLTIIQSKHASRHVWRFVFDPTFAPLNPNTIVRKVLPLKVTRNKQ